MSRQSDYITLVREANRNLWNSINTLVALQREWNAMDYGNTLPEGVGDNAGLTDTEIGAVVFDTANAMVAVLNNGHATNMAKLL